LSEKGPALAGQRYARTPIEWIAKLNYTQLKVLMAISCSANYNDYAFPGIDTIAKRACMHKPNTYRAIKELRNLGYLIEKDGGYYVVFYPHQSSASEASNKCASNSNVHLIGEKLEKKLGECPPSGMDAVDGETMMASRITNKHVSPRDDEDEKAKAVRRPTSLDHRAELLRQYLVQVTGVTSLGGRAEYNNFALLLRKYDDDECHAIIDQAFRNPKQSCKKGGHLTIQRVIWYADEFYRQTVTHTASTDRVQLIEEKIASATDENGDIDVSKLKADFYVLDVSRSEVLGRLNDSILDRVCNGG
jgi:hypothetical protein